MTDLSDFGVGVGESSGHDREAIAEAFGVGVGDLEIVEELETRKLYRTIRTDLRLWDLQVMEDHLDLEGESFEVVSATIEGEAGSEHLKVRILATTEQVGLAGWSA